MFRLLREGRIEDDVEVEVEGGVDSMVSGYAVTFSREQANTIQLVGTGRGKFGGRTFPPCSLVGC